MRNRGWAALLFLLGAVALASCATAPKPRPIEKSFMFPDASYDEVWKATNQALEQRGLPVDIADKELGILTTDWFHFTYTVTRQDTNYADCGTLDLFSHELDRRGRLKLLVRGDSTGVTLKINVEYEQSYADQPGSDAIVRSCVSTGYMEGRIRVLVAEGLAGRH